MIFGKKKAIDVPKDTKGDNKLPGNTFHKLIFDNFDERFETYANAVSSGLASALFGNSSAKNYKDLAQAATKSSIFNTEDTKLSVFASINSNITDLLKNIENISKIQNEESNQINVNTTTNFPIDNLIKQLKENIKIPNYNNKLNNINKSINDFKKLFVFVSKIDYNKLFKEIKDITKISSQEIIDLLKNIDNSLTVDNNTEDTDKIKGSIELIFRGYVGEDIKTLADLNDLLKNTFNENIKELTNYYTELDKLYDLEIAVGNKAELAKKANKSITDTTKAIEETAVKTNTKEEEIKKGTVTMKELGDFIMEATISMIIGGIIMLVKPELFVASIKFAFSLSLFVAYILGVIVLISKFGDADILDSVKKLNSFILTCTIVMLIGAFFMMKANGDLAYNALAFGIVLGVFIAFTVAPIVFFSKYANNIMQGLKDFNAFIIVCTFVMLIGAFFVANTELVKNALHFAWVFALFELIVVAPIFLFSLFKDSLMKGLRDFAVFIMVCTIVMLIGAFFVKNTDLVENALGFGLLLATFEALVILPLLLFRAISPAVMKGLKDFSIFIITVTACLLVGALFVRIGGGEFAWAALKFTGILFLFELGVVAPLLLFKRVAKDVKKAAKELALLVGICSLCLIGGALFIYKYGADTALKYTGVLAAFIAAMSIILFAIGKFDDAGIIKKGKKAALGIAMAIGALSLALVATHFAVELGGGFLQIMKDVGTLCAAVAAFSILFGIMGIPVLAANIVVGSIVAASMGITLLLLGGALFVFSFITKNDPDLLEHIAYVTGSLGLIAALMGLLISLSPAIIAATVVSLAFATFVTSLSFSMWLLSKAIKEIKTVGEFSNEKIGNTITNFIGIVDFIDFGGITGYLGKLKNIKNLKKIVQPLSETISLIALAVQHMANLKVAEDWDENGKPKKWRQINDNDFKLCKDNIATIITNLASGISSAYTSLKTIIDDNNFKSVLYATKQIGSIIGGIANGVSKMANMMIPTKWNNDGVPIEFRQMDSRELGENGLRKSLTDILEATFNAIIGVYNKNKALFTETNLLVSEGIFGSKKYIKKSKISSVLSATFTISQILSNLVNNIVKVAQAQIPDDWDANGKPIHFTSINFTEIQSKLGITLANIVGCMAMGLGKVMKKYPDLFNMEDDETETPMAKGIKAVQGVTGIIASITDTIVKIATSQIPVFESYDPKTGKFKQYKQLDLNKCSEDLKNNIGTIIDAIIDSSKSIFDKFDKYKLDNSDINKTNDKIKCIVDTINSVLDIVVRLSEMKYISGYKDGNPVYTAYDAETVKARYKSIMNDDGKDLASLIIDSYNSLKKKFDKVYWRNIIDITKKLESLNNIIKSINDIAKIEKSKTDKELKSNFDILKEGITGIGNAMESVNKNTEFDENIKQLNTFIKETINNIDVQKTDKFIELANALRALSDKTTNLDSLTNAIANNLTIVLQNLVIKLDESKETINKTEEIQKKRHILINESIDKIKSIMSRSIEVKVTTTSNNSTDNSGGSYGGNSSPSNSSTHANITSNSNNSGSGNTLTPFTNNDSELATTSTSSIDNTSILTNIEKKVRELCKHFEI